MEIERDGRQRERGQKRVKVSLFESRSSTTTIIISGSAFSPRFRCHVGKEGGGGETLVPFLFIHQRRRKLLVSAWYIEKENRNGKRQEDANEREGERLEKRFSPLAEPSETETARYQGCKEQAEDVNCLVTFPVQPEAWKWPSNEVGSCSDSRKHSNQLSLPRLRPVSPFVLSLPVSGSRGTRERTVEAL